MDKTFLSSKLKYWAFLFLWFCSFSLAQNKIDALKSKTEVQEFVRTAIKSDTLLKNFELVPIQDFHQYVVYSRTKTVADSLGINKSFYKGDFDGNGLTDLLFIGDNKCCTGSYHDGTRTVDYSANFSVNVILDMGGGKYTLENILFNQFSKVIPIIKKHERRDYIEVLYDQQSEDLEARQYRTLHKIITKILIYNFDNFVEYNPSPSQLSVEKIIYETGKCFGKCPIFNLELNKKGESFFFAKSSNFITNSDIDEKMEGQFATQISSKEFEKLEKILNYIDFSNLENDYSRNWTDNQNSTSLLTIVYNNGQTKKIRDYSLPGISGTYGLKALYSILSELRFNQNWERK
ncbi:DUF6438 domain-containing protein [Chryseobacterium sp.]|uniref:DUF6438 domain-containing protein n=1 Tax=Chryseobacterium sp. TaxID=1871047 RepID=UPI0025C6DAA3|nr:DUF6438 domain-containing protein [Chryseobacterium sp.]